VSAAAAAPAVTQAKGAIGLAASRLSRQFKRWLHRLQSALGIRRGVRVRGAYFKELTAESLPRAFSRKGRGWKDYRVTFPDGSKQMIRCSPQRVFDDLMGPLGFDAGQGVLAPLLEIIRPGARIILLRGGTGAAAAWLGAAVGSSGAVVALEEDEQSALFALKRYPRPNISFENGAIEELTGETDGSFDGAAVVRPTSLQDGGTALRELWRVVAPGGWMLVCCEPGTGDAIVSFLKSLPLGDATALRPDGARSPDLVFATKRPEPGETAPRSSPQGRGNGGGGTDPEAAV
jgi:hypothetical protein